MNISELSVAIFNQNLDFLMSFQELLSFYVRDIPLTARDKKSTMRAVTALREMSVHAALVGIVGGYPEDTKDVIGEIREKYPRVYTIGVADRRGERRLGSHSTIFYGDVADKIQFPLKKAADFQSKFK